MEIKYSQTYYQGYKLLSRSDRQLVNDTINLFYHNPQDPVLENHPLKKPMTGRRAISARDDLRIIFREKGDYMEVLMLDV